MTSAYEIYGLVPGIWLEDARHKLALLGNVVELERLPDDPYLELLFDGQPNDASFCSVLVWRQTSKVREVDGDVLLKNGEVVLRVGDDVESAKSLMSIDRHVRTKGREFLGLCVGSIGNSTLDLVVMVDEGRVSNIGLALDAYRP